MPPEEDKNTPVIQSIDETQKTEHPPRQENDTQDGKEGRRPEDAPPPVLETAEEKPPREGGDGGKGTRPPLKNGLPPMSRWQYGFWLFILILIPLFAVLRSKDSADTEVLTQKAFEDKLRNGRIVELTTVVNSEGIVRVKGVFIPDGSTPDVQRKFQSKVIYSDALDELIRDHCSDYSASSEGSSFMQIVMMLLPTVLLIAFFYFIFIRQMRSGGNAMSFGKSRARREDPDDNHPITFKDVAGCDEAKEDMRELVDYLKDPVAFGRLGGRIPRGVLLVGPPGTGKTLLAKAIAGEAKVPFFSISGSDFVEMFVGVGAARVRDMFEEGKKSAPCIIFIDEIDAVGRSRFSGIGGGHDEREQTLNALLVEMDGFQANQGVIIIAATNRPDVLDPALLRPGRFDRQVTVDLPDMRGRVAILKVHARKTRLAEDVDLRIIARGTPGFSGADLENLINEAALLATRRKLDAVGMPELEEARDKVRWGRERRSHKMDDKARRLTAFHEAGHALVGMCCPDAMPLHKITIIPRGPALGATMTLPKNDENTVSKRQILDMIAVCYGGRTAEELAMNDISTGASMDIKQATDLAKKMVCQWGMSDRLGLINYAGREEHLFLGRDITRSEDFSPETAREIDLEIRRIVDEQKSRATEILSKHRECLDKLANALLEQETLSAKQVYELLGWQMPEDDTPQDEELDDPEAADLLSALKHTRETTEETADEGKPADPGEEPQDATKGEEKQE